MPSTVTAFHLIHNPGSADAMVSLLNTDTGAVVPLTPGSGLRRSITIQDASNISLSIYGGGNFHIILMQ